jgi:hypothetical protein
MTTVKHLTREDKKSYGIQVTTKDDKFVVPVMDVRDGEQERAIVNNMVKNSRQRSQFLQPSFGSGGNCYQVSQKKN